MQTVEQSSPDYKQLYEQQVAVIEQLSQQLAAHDDKVASMSAEIARLRKLIFGVKVERFVPAAGVTTAELQLSLNLQAETVAHCKLTSATTVSYVRTNMELVPAKPKAHPGRMKLPDHLRREVILLQPEGDVSGLRRMGEDVTEILDYIPAELYVKQYIRPKYAAPLSEGGSTVLMAALPGRMLEKCMAGEGLLAQLIVDKYLDHLPIHRQLQRYERMGVKIAQSTSNDWFRMVLNHLAALYEAHKRITLATSYIGADETPIKVLDEDKKGTTHQGYYWVYHNAEHKLVLFDYRPGRGREGPNDILKDFQGYLQTDGYSAYEAFNRRPGITLLHCMAHARRKFHEALPNDPPRAEYALGLFQQLYAIERRIKEQERTAEEVVQLRQQEALPVLQTLNSWMREEYPKLIVKKVPSPRPWDTSCLVLKSSVSTPPMHA